MTKEYYTTHMIRNNVVPNFLQIGVTQVIALLNHCI